MKEKGSRPKKAQSPTKAADEEAEMLASQEVVCRWAELSLVELIRLAATADNPALLFLAGVAVKAVRALNEIATRFPERVQPIAREWIAWPALISRKAATERQNKKLMDDIQLGAGSIHRGQWQVKAPTIEAAQMFLWLKEHQARLKLPKLSSETWTVWFKAGWKELLRVTGGHPEKDEKLRAIGEHYGEHSKHRGAQKVVTPATREANIRTGIRKQIHQSFKGYVSGLWAD